MDTTGAGAATGRGDEPAVGDSVGRYVIERVLGAGGMGVVYAAHDPDLDRRVALKLLRGAGRDQAEARSRLLREARAMAKLSHPNVITVHEVGTDGARDFVAMELIDGQSVAEWFATPRPRPDVLRVMLAAGRGLAAAHAAGLVHRDFKPHNVLRGRDGRVVVTDFGLARAFDDLAAEPVPAAPLPSASTGLEETMAATPARTPSRSDAASLSSTLTRTGAMLGTPAYMAPEQFAGRSSGPATDQFAFCVALWEGLAGTRPFHGGSLDELRDAVETGVAEGGAPIPRRFRRVLERGMRRDPAARWPSMDALLAALERATLAPRRAALIAAGATLLGASVAIFAIADRPAKKASPCPSGDKRFAEVWSADRAAALDRRFGDDRNWKALRGAVDEFGTSWKTTWQAACAAPEDPRFHGKVACLDGALDELDAVGSVLDQAPPELLRAIPVEHFIASPSGCADNTRVGFPQLPDDPAVRAEVVRLHRELALARAWARTGRGEEALAKAEAALASARAIADRYPAMEAEALEASGTIHHILGDLVGAEPLYEEAARVAEETGHDPARAMALLGYLEIVNQRTSDGQLVRKIADQARAAIKRAGDDPVLLAGVEINLATRMATEGDLDGAITRIEAARQVDEQAHDLRRASVAAGLEAEYLILRDGAGDMERAETLLRESLAGARTVYGDNNRVTQNCIRVLGWQRWNAGDLEEAHQLFGQLASPPGPQVPTSPLRGRVVDATGAVVAGAHVYAGRRLFGDPLEVVLSSSAMGAKPIATAVTDIDGTFTLDAPTGAVVMADDGGRVAGPVAVTGDAVELTLVAPGGVTGTLTLTGEIRAGDEPALALARHVSYDRAGVSTAKGPHGRYIQIAPVARDGTWALPAAAPGSLVAVGFISTSLDDVIQVFRPITLAPGGTASADLTLDRAGVLLDVIVRADRAADIPTAEVHVMPGWRVKGTLTSSELFPIILGSERDHAGIAVPVSPPNGTTPGRALYADGDIHARLSSVPPGKVTICAIPLAGDIADASFADRLSESASDLEATCTQTTIAAEPSVQAVVAEVPPPRRIP